MNKPNKRKQDRRNELRRAEARRQADLCGENDFLCNDFDTLNKHGSNTSPTERHDVRYVLVAAVAGLLIVLGVLIGPLLKGICQ